MECKICDYQCDDTYEMEIHLVSSHKDTRATCKLCGGVFKSVLHHLSKVHSAVYEKAKKEGSTAPLITPSDGLRCVYCDRVFSTVQYVINHIRSKHAETKVECDVCHAILKRAALYDHKRNKHKDASSYYQFECETCKLKFKHELTYKKHLATESHRITEKRIDLDMTEIDEKVRAVKIAGRKIPEKKSRSESKQVMSATCAICHVVFADGRKLYRHTNSVHKQTKYPCDVCEKVLSRKDTLTRHIETVHRKRYVDCEQCHKKVLERNYYERHIKLCLINAVLRQYPGSSSWERMVSKVLMDRGIDFVCQHTFDDLRSKARLSYDFYVESLNMIIEIHGPQHYVASSYKNGQEKLIETQTHDKMKAVYARNHSIRLVVIDTRLHNTFEKVSAFILDAIPG